MTVPTSVIVPIFLVSFGLFMFQYQRIDPDRRLLNVQFAMMVGAIALTICTSAMSAWGISLWFLLLALIWLGTACYLLRRLPPPRRKRKRH